MFLQFVFTIKLLTLPCLIVVDFRLVIEAVTDVLALPCTVVPPVKTYNVYFTGFKRQKFYNLLKFINVLYSFGQKRTLEIL